MNDLFDEIAEVSSENFTAYVRLQGQRRWHAACTGPDLWETWRRVLRPTSCDVIVLPRGEAPR